MIDTARNKFSGETVEEWLDMLPYELEGDATGLWTIIPAGRHDFGLTGDDLIEFTRRGLLALLREGAKPVHGSKEALSGWELAEGYGDTPEQIAEAVIVEWLASGGGDPDVSALWFATPKIYATPQKWKLEPLPATLEDARYTGRGWTVAEWQERLTGLLALGPVAFWLVVLDGRTYFRLTGENLTEFVRLGLLTLLRAGARPLERPPGSPLGWKPLERYGDTPEQIAEAVIAEWVASGCADPDDKAAWFGTATVDAPHQPAP